MKNKGDRAREKDPKAEDISEFQIVTNHAYLKFGKRSIFIALKIEINSSICRIEQKMDMELVSEFQIVTNNAYLKLGKEIHIQHSFFCISKLILRYAE